MTNLTYKKGIEYETILKPGEKISLDQGEERTILVWHFSDHEIILEKEAKLTFVAFLREGLGIDRRKLHFRFEGEGAELTCLILTIGKAEDVFSFETLSEHCAERTKGYFRVRSILADHAKVDYEGRLIIRPQAKLADTHLAHHSLLLSPNAKVRTIPSLEIEANDVRAGHSATIGKVDDELLFYLESRGIDRKAAKALLVKSFLEGDLKEVSDEKVRDLLKDSLEQAAGSLLKI